jgi:hypothetical protein
MPCARGILREASAATIMSIWLANTINAHPLGMLVNFTEAYIIGSEYHMDKESKTFQHHDFVQHHVFHDTTGLRGMEELNRYEHKIMAAHELLHCIILLLHNIIKLDWST